MSSQSSAIAQGMAAMDEIKEYGSQACAQNVVVYCQQLAIGSDPDDQKFVVGTADENPPPFVTSYDANAFASVEIPNRTNDPKGLWKSITLCIPAAGNPGQLVKAYGAFTDAVSVNIPLLGQYNMRTYRGPRGNSEGTLVGMGALLDTTVAGERLNFEMEPNPRSIGQEGRMMGTVWTVAMDSVSSGGQVVLGGSASGALLANAGNFPINNTAAVIAQISSPSQGVTGIKLGTADGGVAAVQGVYHSDQMMPVGDSRGFEEVYATSVLINAPAGPEGAIQLNGAGTVCFCMDGQLDTVVGSQAGPSVAMLPGPDFPPMQKINFKVEVETPASNIATNGLAAYGNSFMPSNSNPLTYWNNAPVAGGPIDISGIAQPTDPSHWPSIDPWPNSAFIWGRPTLANQLNPWNPALYWPTPIIGVPEYTEPPRVGSIVTTYVHSTVVGGVVVTSTSTLNTAVYAPRGTGMGNATSLVPAFWLGRTPSNAALGSAPPPSTGGAFAMAGSQYVHVGEQAYVELAKQVVVIECPATVTGRINSIVCSFQVKAPSVTETVGDFFYGVSTIAPNTFNPQEFTSGVLGGINDTGIVGSAAPVANDRLASDYVYGYNTFSISNYIKASVNDNIVAPGIPSSASLFPNFTAGRWAVPGSLLGISGNVLNTPGMAQQIPYFLPTCPPMYRDDVALPSNGQYAQGLYDGRPGGAVFLKTIDTNAANAGEYGWMIPNQNNVQTNGSSLIGGGKRSFYPNEGPVVGTTTFVIRTCMRDMGVDPAGSLQPGAPFIGVYPATGVSKVQQVTMTCPSNSWKGFQYRPLQPMCAPIIVNAAGTTVLPGTSGTLAVNIAQPLWPDLPKCCRLLSIQAFYKRDKGCTNALQVINLEDISAESNLVIRMRTRYEVVQSGRSAVAQLNYDSNLPRIGMDFVYLIRTLFTVAQVPCFMSIARYNAMTAHIADNGIDGLMDVLRQSFANKRASNDGNAAFNFGGALRSLASKMSSVLPVVRNFFGGMSQDPDLNRFANRQLNRAITTVGRDGLGLDEEGGQMLGALVNHGARNYMRNKEARDANMSAMAELPFAGGGEAAGRRRGHRVEGRASFWDDIKGGFDKGLSTVEHLAAPVVAAAAPMMMAAAMKGRACGTPYDVGGAASRYNVGGAAAYNVGGASPTPYATMAADGQRLNRRRV